MKITNYKILLATTMLALAPGLQAQMHVDAMGNVGVGTMAPTSPVHVRLDDAKVVVEDTNAITAPRELFKVINNGNAKFSVVETVSAENWAFANPGLDQFRLSKQGSGVVEMTIFGGGDVVIAGSLTQGSDRNIKTAIVDLDTAEILNKVRALPITQWQYKHAIGVNHVGPMAQDFKAAFDLGNTDKGIVAVDADGIALAAIQELAKENLQLKQAHRELLTAFSAMQDNQQQLQQFVNQLIENKDGQSIYTSLK